MITIISSIFILSIMIILMIIVIANCAKPSSEKQLRQQLLENNDKDIIEESIQQKTFLNVFEKVKQMSEMPLEKTSISIDILEMIFTKNCSL